MENKKKLLQKYVLEPKQLYFELQSSWGITKHIGGFKATKELIELCHINKGKYVLEVGCGVGITACYIAQEYEGKVVGVDISERMIKTSRERAKRKNIEGRVEFILADAQNLPFEDELFDAVICESVNVFVKDKLKALKEYIRVIKPDGYVGINEGIWIKEPIKELDEYIYNITGAKLLAPNYREELLKSSELRNIETRIYKINFLNEAINQIKRFDFKEYFRAWYTFLFQLIKNPDSRKFAKEAFNMPKGIFKFLEYAGYGIYVGMK